MNARTLRISLAIGWLILPFVTCAGAFSLIGDETGTTAVAMSAALALPFIVGTTVYVAIVVKRCTELPTKHILDRLLLYSSLLALASWAIVANTTSRRITPDTVSDSPFDKHWYSTAQTAYGSPFPFLRYFDDNVPDAGYEMFDVSSLLANLTIWSFPAFVIASIAYEDILDSAASGAPREF